VKGPEMTSLRMTLVSLSTVKKGVPNTRLTVNICNNKLLNTKRRFKKLKNRTESLRNMVNLYSYYQANFKLIRWSTTNRKEHFRESLRKE
jgi:hypothetical protein